MKKGQNVEQVQPKYRRVFKPCYSICFTFKDKTTKEYGYKTEDEMKKDFEKIKLANWETDKFVGEFAIFLLSEIMAVECLKRYMKEYVEAENDNAN